MSLTIVKQPPAIGLANNPIEFRFSTSNLYTSPGDFARWQLTTSSIPSAGKQLIFSWLNNTVIFTTSISPNDSGYEIGLPAGLITEQEWVDNYLIPALQANYYINSDFEIYGVLGAGSVIEIKSRKKGSAFNISFATDSALGQLVGANILSGADQAIRPNFETFLDLYIAKNTTTDWQKVNATQTNATAESRFPLQSILGADYFGSALPTFADAAIKNISSALIKYYAKYGEAFGEPKLIQKLATSATYYALQGGFTKDDFTQKSFLIDFANNKKTFLHWPSSFKLTSGQMHFLNYLHYNTESNFKVYAEILYTDKTTEIKTLFTHSSAVVKPSLFCIPANYAQIAAVKDPAKTVFSYQIWVGDVLFPAVLYSQKINHVVDLRGSVDNSFFLFKNSFGVYEVARCTGLVQELGNFSKQKATRILQADYAITDAATITYGQSEQRSWLINSGHKTKAEMQFFVDFLQSPSIYKIQSTVFVPVSLEISEAELAATRSGRLNNATFTILADAANKNQSHV